VKRRPTPKQKAAMLRAAARPVVVPLPSSEALRSRVAQARKLAAADGSPKALAVVEACDDYIAQLDRFEGGRSSS